MMYAIPCRNLKDYHIIDTRKTPRGTNEIILTYIDEDEESLIDALDKDSIIIKRGNRSFNISQNKIYCYGDVDFNNYEDLKQIDSFNLITRQFQGFIIPSDYNYDLHVAYSNNKKFYKYTETWQSSKVVKYIHGCLGKPKKILLFNSL